MKGKDNLLVFVLRLNIIRLIHENYFNKKCAAYQRRP